jgi:hypothetical protein
MTPVPVISRQQSEDECDALMDAVLAARRAKDTDREVASLRACLDHPCAAHELRPAELCSELAGTYRSAGRFDDAIGAWERAIAVGYRSVPHPRADIAELLLTSDRREEADELFSELRAQCESDVWLYNSAGFSYAHAGDDEEDLHWIDSGIELALATGDPEDILGQLGDLRTSSLKALGRALDDDLSKTIEAFERPPCPRYSITDFYGGDEPDPVYCAHCGWDPSEEPTTRMPLAEVQAIADALKREPAPRSDPANSRSGATRLVETKSAPAVRVISRSTVTGLTADFADLIVVIIRPPERWRANAPCAKVGTNVGTQRGSMVPRRGLLYSLYAGLTCSALAGLEPPTF